MDGVSERQRVGRFVTGCRGSGGRSDRQNEFQEGYSWMVDDQILEIVWVFVMELVIVTMLTEGKGGCGVYAVT